jgi:translocation and assembly module TamB
MRLARTFGWLVALLLVLAVATALVLRWASRSEGVLRWGIAKLGEELPCQLTVQGLSGSLTEPIRIQRLVCESDALRVDASQVALDWSPWALMHERLDIARLQAATLVVESRGKTEGALAVPANLALPLPVHLARLELGTVTVESRAEPITLHEIDASYDGDALSHHLVLRRLTSPWGSLQGELQLGAQAPLALSATLKLVSPVIDGWPIAAEVGLSGELRRIRAQITGSAGRLPVHAELTLAPFDPDPVPAIAARVEGLDINTLLAAAPTTAIDAELKGAARGTDSVSGTFTAVNAQAGTLDQRRLPLRTLTAHATLTRAAVVLEQAQVSLGSAGAATGFARVDAGGIAVDLTTDSLNLHALHAALRATHLAGSVRIQAESSRQLIKADLRQDNLRVQADAAIANDQLTLTQLAAQAAGASLRGSGELHLAGDFAFSAQTVLHDFDPARFGDFPAARINGEIAARGHLRPDWGASLRYRLAPSSLRGHALGGDGALTLSARHVQDVNAVRPDLAGRMRAKGKLGGTPGRPELDATLEADELSYGGYRVQRGTAAARIVQADDPRLHLDGKVEGLARGTTRLDALAVTVEGTLSGHAIALTATGTGVDLHAQARGGYDPKQHLWSGTLENLASTGDFALDLTKAAQLQIGAEHFVLGRTGIAFAGGNLTLEETRFAGGELASSGSMTGMPLARLLRIARQTPRLQSTLVLGGRWSLRGREQIEGVVEIAREKGDLVITSDEQPVALGLTEVKLTLRAARDVLSARASVRGTNFEVQASGETLLSRRDGKWGIAGDAPLKLQAHADLGSIRPAVGLLTSTVTGDGKVSMNVSADGTVADPRLRGEISGDQLRIEQVESGVFLREGVLRATFANRAVQLNTFTIRGGDGEFSATGLIGLRGRQLDLKLDWAARKLTAVQHPDLRLTVSGKGNVSVQDGHASVRGALTADRGRVELRSNSAPALGEDVVVAGRKPKPTVTARSLRPQVDLALDLGPDFIVRGRGLDAKLEGKVTLIGAGDAPLEAKGQISVVRGTYEAYGQRLEIDKGVLYFVGPLDNPGLEIVAMRKHLQVEAGVEVTGTARNPRVRLISNPDVPDSEKLSWLVLGRGVEGAGTLEAEKLQAAAMALAAGLGTAPLQQQLARAVGLDEIRIASTSSSSRGQQSSVVAVGKRVSDRIYLTYEHSLSAATNVLRISYQLTRNWSVRTEAGTAGAVDVFYTLSFD